MKYAHGFVLHFPVVMSLLVLVFLCDTFTHILQGYFTGTGAIIGLPLCLWSNPEGYDCPNAHEVTLKDMDKFYIYQTTIKHKPMCIICGMYCADMNYYGCTSPVQIGLFYDNLICLNQCIFYGMYCVHICCWWMLIPTLLALYGILSGPDNDGFSQWSMHWF